MAPAGNDRKFFYNRFADEFDDEMNKYDLNKRLSVIFKGLLRDDEIKNKRLLDLGCGTGWFSKTAMHSGAEVFSIDLGADLLKKVSEKCSSRKAVADAICLGIKDESFEYVVATEVIEHTLNPLSAITEMHRVLKNNGVLVLTVPNRIWKFSVFIANMLKIRSYEGYENWVGYYQLRGWLEDSGFRIEEMFGFHLFPFVFPFLNPLLNTLDKFSYFYSPVMLNIAVRCRKIK